MKEHVEIEDILGMIKISSMIPISSYMMRRLITFRFKMLITPSKLAQKKLSEMGIEYKN